MRLLRRIVIRHTLRSTSVLTAAVVVDIVVGPFGIGKMKVCKGRIVDFMMIVRGNRRLAVRFFVAVKRAMWLVVVVGSSNHWAAPRVRYRVCVLIALLRSCFSSNSLAIVVVGLMNQRLEHLYALNEIQAHPFLCIGNLVVVVGIV